MGAGRCVPGVRVLCLLREDGPSLGQLSAVSAALPKTNPSQALLPSLQAPTCSNFPGCKVMLVGGGIEH